MRFFRALQRVIPDVSQHTPLARSTHRLLCTSPSPIQPTSSGAFAHPPSTNPIRAYTSQSTTAPTSPREDDPANSPERIGSYVRAFPRRKRVVLDEQEAWIDGKPTRVIASKLLDAPDFIMPHGKLYDVVAPSGLFHSRRHFKQCLRILRAMKRIRITCLGEKEGMNGADGSQSRRRKGHRKGVRQDLSFAIELTKRGKSVYSYYRRVSKLKAEQGDMSFTKRDGGRGKSPGLTDAV